VLADVEPFDLAAAMESALARRSQAEPAIRSKS
jgi:hypothetical protein